MLTNAIKFFFFKCTQVVFSYLKKKKNVYVRSDLVALSSAREKRLYPAGAELWSSE